MYCYNFEMEENTKQCFVIKFFFRADKSVEKMFEIVKVAYGEFVMSCARVSLV